MAVDFTSDMQQELNYFAGPRGMGVDGIYTDCTRTTNEWLALMCASQPRPFITATTSLLHHVLGVHPDCTPLMLAST